MSGLYLMKVWRLRSNWDPISSGVYRQILTYDDDIMLMIVKIQPRSTVLMHSHKNIQAGIVIKGKLLFMTERGKIEVSEGDSYYIEAYERHEVHNLADSEAIALDVFVPKRDDYLPHARQADHEI